MDPAEISFRKLDLTQKTAKVNQNFGKVVECELEYSLDESTIDQKEEYWLMAVNRTKPGAYPWNEQVCAMVQCYESLNGQCKQFQQAAPLKTHFRSVRITGKFLPEVQVFPSVIGDQHLVVSPKENNFTITNDGSNKWTIQRTGSESFVLGTVGFYGRDYTHDVPLDKLHP